MKSDRIVVYGSFGYGALTEEQKDRVRVADCFWGNGRNRQGCGCATCTLWRNVKARENRKKMDRRRARIARALGLRRVEVRP